MSVYSEAIANFLKPISNLLDDPKITEIMINGHKEVYVETKGLVHRVPNTFRDDDALLSAIRAIAQSVGRIIDEDNPLDVAAKSPFANTSSQDLVCVE